MFDTSGDLATKIALGEDTSLELKAVSFRGDKIEGPKRSDLADEIAAMANTADGVLVLGVEDAAREVTGIPREKLDRVERYVFEICNDSIEPPVVFRTYRLKLPDAAGALRPLLKVEIPRSLFVHKSPGGIHASPGQLEARDATRPARPTLPAAEPGAAAALR